VLALHGVTGHGARFRRLAAEGLPELRWIAPDLRGHGRSDWNPPWSVEQLVTDAIQVLDAEGLGRVTVIGHSYGGLLATHLAARDPQRVERLVLLDPSIGRDPAEMLEAAEETRRDEGWDSAETARAERTSGFPVHARAEVAADVEEALELGDDGRWRLRYCRSAVVTGWSEMAAPPTSIARWPGSALVLEALRDGTTTEAAIEQMRGDLGPRLTHHTLDCGHVVYWEVFDEVVAQLRAFLLEA
jgi:lipase